MPKQVSFIKYNLENITFVKIIYIFTTFLLKMKYIFLHSGGRLATVESDFILKDRKTVNKYINEHPFTLTFCLVGNNLPSSMVPPSNTSFCDLYSLIFKDVVRIGFLVRVPAQA